MSDLPVDTLKEAIPFLRRPFAPEAMKFKVQAQWPKDNPRNGLIVSYIDARLVAERLNAVCPHLWFDEYSFYGERPDTNLIVCHLTIGEVTRTDVGEGQGKAGYSDAFKRAGVKFGIGTVCYALAAVTLGASQAGELDSNGNPTLTIKQSGQKKTLAISPAADRWLREKYAAWLKARGERDFGEALSHGDVEGSVGAALDEPAQAPQGAQDGLETAAEREELEKLYEEKIASQNGKRSKFTKGKFQAQLRAADSPEKLTELRTRIEEAAK